MSDPRVIVALDFADQRAVLNLVDQLDSAGCKLKVGFELFVSQGPGIVTELAQRGFDVFLDLKFHDIPNTVARACLTAARLDVWMVNVHACGGRHMLEAARQAVDRSTGRKPKLVAVTLLTSLDDDAVKQLGFKQTAEQTSIQLAQLALDTGMDGIVCSAQELRVLRPHFEDDLLYVTPGIRPGHSQTDDQKRVMSSGDAIRAGSDYLVIGRPITQANEPMAVLEIIKQELQALND